MTPTDRPTVRVAALLLVAVAAFSPLATFAQEQQKLAVLEFEVQPGLTIDRRTFSSRLQNAARTAAPQLSVMTQQNIEVLIKGSGRTLADCEGQCAVDTGRLLGADLVISGRISKVGSRFSVSMQLHETSKGVLVAGSDGEAATEDDLLKVSAEVAERVLAKLARNVRRRDPEQTASEGRIGESTKDVALTDADVLVKFESIPSGAVVQLDGALLCQSTPCSKLVPRGLHETRMEREGWEPVTQPLVVAEAAHVMVTLVRSTATLRVETTPPNIRVTLDAKPLGQSPAVASDVAPGTHDVLVEAPCWLRAGERVVLKKGEDRVLSLRAEARMAGLKLVAEDGKGDALPGSAFVDDRELGPVPGSYKLMLCSHLLTVKAPGGRSWTSNLQLKEGEVANLLTTLPMETRPNVQRRVAVATAVGGGVGAAVALFFGIKMYSAAADWQNAPTLAAWSEARERANTASTRATVSGVIGGALLVTGVALWLLADN
jgi:TolB-like protein